MRGLSQIALAASISVSLFGPGKQPCSDRTPTPPQRATKDRTVPASSVHRAADSDELRQRPADAARRARELLEQARSLRLAEELRVHGRLHGRIGAEDGAVVMYNGERYREWRGSLCGPERNGVLYLSIVKPAVNPRIVLAPPQRPPAKPSE